MVEDADTVDPLQEPPLDREPALHEEIMVATTVRVGGVDIQLNDTPAVIETVSPLYKKEARAALSDDKRNELFERATKKSHALYDLISLSLNDEDKLDDTYNLSMLIGKTKDSFVQFDMHDVCTILLLDSTDNKTVVHEKDLFRDYQSLRIEDVARSNDWYHKWPIAKTYAQNLQLTYKFLQNNVADKLWEKCFERYTKFKPTEQGGPLFFLIMLQQLVSNTDEAARALQLRLEKLNISEITGENVDKAVSQIRGAVDRLEQINKTPPDLTRKLLVIFQTTSVLDFNGHFKALEQKRVREGILDGKATTYDADKLCDLAEQLYHQKLETNEWTGLTTKGKDSIFTAAKGKGIIPVCWNCGENGHLVNECPKAPNSALVEKNRTAFRERRKEKKDKNKNNNNKNKNPTPPGKWAAPKEGDGPRRTINGKPMYYLYKAKRWVPDRTPPQAGITVVTQPVPLTVLAPAITPTSTVAETSSVASRNQAIDVALANASRGMSTALAGLAEQFREG
jgi:hypothetical protein